MSDIFPWALMLPDPTTSVMAVWCDTRVNRPSPATPQTVVYGPNDTSIQSTVLDVPAGSSGDIHTAIFTDLEPGSLCQWSLPSLELTFKPIKILPSTLPTAGLTGMTVSDMHCGARTVDTPQKFTFCGSERPDFIIMPGDSSHASSFTRSSTNTNRHIATFRDYFQQWHGDFIPQIIAEPGNHWVGNAGSNGENFTSVSGVQFAANSLFEIFHPNVSHLPPFTDPLENPNVVNCRHMAVTIGNYLQIISGDVYSNSHQSARQAFIDHHNPDPGFCIWMSHSPMFSRSQRQNADHTLQSRLRDSMFKLLAERENTAFCFGGNIHVDSATKKLSHTTTDTGDSLPIDDGYVSVAPSDEWKTIVEYGQGMLANRDDATDPVVPVNFFDRYERPGLNYYLLKMYPGKCIVEDKNDLIGLVSTKTYFSPLGVKSDGSLGRSYSKDGRPVYPR